MINYIRTHRIESTQLQNLNPSLWDNDDYLKPVLVDAWLLYGMIRYRVFLYYQNNNLLKQLLYARYRYRRFGRCRFE